MAIEHTQGGVTTRDDVGDMGVPMAEPEKADRHQAHAAKGPEDALAVGPQRGDYTARHDRTAHYVFEPIPEDEREPGGPAVRRVVQG